jgi:hypothetical protein
LKFFEELLICFCLLLLNFLFKSRNPFRNPLQRTYPAAIVTLRLHTGSRLVILIPKIVPEAGFRVYTLEKIDHWQEAKMETNQWESKKLE